MIQTELEFVEQVGPAIVKNILGESYNPDKIVKAVKISLVEVLVSRGPN